MFKQIHIVVVFFVAALSSSFAHADLQSRIEWKPSIAIITKIEAKLKLPKSAYSLKQYKRFYAGEIVDGKKILIGIFQFSKKENGIGIVDLIHMPIIMDGGCNVLDFKFLIDENKVVLLECHDDP